MRLSRDAWFVAGAALAMLLAAGAGACSRDTAEREAGEWVGRSGIAGAATTQCADFDTDGDGYVSCTVSYRDRAGATQFVALECPGITSLGSACRLQKPTVRVWR
jgi:hypothetical protein